MPTNWSVAGADKRGDIFWRNTNTGEFTMWVMNGANIAKTVSSVRAAHWTIAGIGDFDGNGSKTFSGATPAGDVGIWLMNGTQFVSGTSSATCRPSGTSSKPAITMEMASATFSGPTAAVMSSAGP